MGWIIGRLARRKLPKINLTEETLKELVEHCMHPNPKSRPAFQTICNILNKFKNEFEFPLEEEDGSTSIPSALSSAPSTAPSTTSSSTPLTAPSSTAWSNVKHKDIDA